MKPIETFQLCLINLMDDVLLKQNFLSVKTADNILCVDDSFSHCFFQLKLQFFKISCPDDGLLSITNFTYLLVVLPLFLKQ